MIGAHPISPVPFPSAYSLTRSQFFVYVLWCCKPIVCPISCELASAIYFGLFSSNTLNTHAGVSSPQVKEFTNDTPAAVPYHFEVGVIIMRTLFDGGAFANTTESVVILRLKILKSSATLLNISVIDDDEREAGFA